MINYRGLDIPFVSFGNVTSDDLFADKEQALFDLYDDRRGQYRNALDIGANIGVHSILMARNGWNVKAYEPDPVHYGLALESIWHNGVTVELHDNAVSDHDGVETFVHVKGNTTGSHLKGDKQPYGELHEFTVNVVDCRPLWEWADFAKIDCEGHEARLLLTVTREQAAWLDCVVEVGNAKNAELIFNHCRSIDWPMWAQQHEWRRVDRMEDMPTHHSHGALLLGSAR